MKPRVNVGLFVNGAQFTETRAVSFPFPQDVLVQTTGKGRGGSACVYSKLSMAYIPCP